VTDEASVQNMVDMTVKECGRIDYLVNSAGVS
jgi:NAD(P)-dependent dehydrogenase (short-subunit alcohol dehydrogenase family)